VKHGRTLFADARHKALFGGRGGAKSWSVATYLVVKAAESRKRIVCARQFQNSIRDSSKELIEKRIAVLELSGEFRITDQSILHLETGSEFVFVGLERNPDSIRSFEGADIFWIEEARTISKKSMEMLLPTVRAPNSEIIWTWNPEQPTDPVDDYFRGGDPPENSIVTRVDYRDNPFFAETAMPAEMLKLQRDNPARFRHIWEGAYDISFESKVFTRVAIGRPDTLINAEPRYGMDFGFSSDPTAIVKVFHLPATGQLYIAAEAHAHGVPTEQLPELLSSIVHDTGALVRADGSRPETIDYLQQRGFGVRPARKGPGSVKDGISFLQSFEILVDPGCEHARNELHGYSWPTDRLTGQVIPGVNPIGVNDHVIDALRYAVEDIIADAPLDLDDGGVLLVPMWMSSRDPREDRWHHRLRR